MTDSINNKFDMPKEWRVKRIYDLNKDNFGLQSAYIYISLHSQFVHLNLSIKAILKIYTFDHLIVWQWLKPKHLLRSLFSTLQVFVELDLSWIYGNVTIKQDCCTKCYNKATMDRLSMIRDHNFVVKYSFQNIHFKAHNY